MPELEKKVLRQEVDSYLKEIQDGFRESAYWVLVNLANAAKEAGVDVSDVEAQMPELKKKILRQKVDFSLKETQGGFMKSAYRVLINYVNTAKEAGVDVSDVEAQMPELKKKCKD